jgi:hypothetical protein
LKKLYIFAPLSLLSLSIQGCFFFNERGVASKYYNDCNHYYDSRGIYHEKCDENIVDYKTLNPKNLVKDNGNGVYYVEF